MPRIERRHWVLVRNLTLLSVAIAAAPTGMRKLRSYLAQDAFADITRPPTNDPLGIRLEGVRFRHYSGNRLLTFAAADRIDVSRDRFHMTMFGIHDGLYRDGDRAFRYQAKGASWDARRRILDVYENVQIKNEKLNLRAKGAHFDSRKKSLTAEGDVKGTLMKGQFFAQNLMYNIRTEGYRVGPVSWTGKLPKKLLQDDVPAEVTQTVWKFKAKLSSSPGGPDKIVTHTDAVATDGEVIVVAPKIVHNQKTDEIVATGTDTERVQYFSVKANLIASRIEVYRKEKRAVLTGNVIMLVKPKKDQTGKVKMEALPAFQPLLPDQVKADPPKAQRPKEETQKDENLRQSKNIRDYPLTMAAAKIEYWYGKGSRRAVITGDPQGRQELPESRWRHIWSNVGFYDGEKEELKLVSTKGRKDTRMKNSVGDDAIADWMVISTREDDEAFSGAGIEGDFADLSGEDDPRNDKKKPETPPTKTPPPGGGPGGGGGNPPIKDRFRRT